MDESPCQPRREPAQLDGAGIQNGEAAPDHCHVAFVEITEWWRRRTASLSIANNLADITALLHGDLRNARQRLAILIKRGRVADDEDLRMARHTTILLDPHASGLVSWRAQPFACGRGRDAGRPNHSAARDAFVADHDACLVNRFDRLPKEQLHANALQAGLGFA